MAGWTRKTSGSECWKRGTLDELFKSLLIEETSHSSKFNKYRQSLKSKAEQKNKNCKTDSPQLEVGCLCWVAEVNAHHSSGRLTCWQQLCWYRWTVDAVFYKSMNFRTNLINENWTRSPPQTAIMYYTTVIVSQKMFFNHLSISNTHRSQGTL